MSIRIVGAFDRGWVACLQRKTEGEKRSPFEQDEETEEGKNVAIDTCAGSSTVDTLWQN